AMIWDVNSRQLKQKLKGHTAGIASLTFSPDSRTLVTGSGDHTVRFWQVSTGQEMLRLKDFGEQIFNLLFSSDGRILATGGISWARGHEPVQLWCAPTLNEIDSSHWPDYVERERTLESPEHAQQ